MKVPLVIVSGYLAVDREFVYKIVICLPKNAPKWSASRCHPVCRGRFGIVGPCVPPVWFTCVAERCSRWRAWSWEHWLATLEQAIGHGHRTYDIGQGHRTRPTRPTTWTLSYDLVLCPMSFVISCPMSYVLNQI